MADTEQLATFEHLNLSDVDPTFKPIPKAMRVLEISRFAPRKITVKKETSQNFGKEMCLIDGRFRVVDDPEYSGRSLPYTFWLNNTYDQKALRRLADGIGVMQEAGEPLDSWAQRVAQLSPPAKFKLFVDEVEEAPSDGEKAIPVNKLRWNNVVPV